MDKKAFETYWYLLNERHNIYNRKTNKEDWPWTENKVLQEYKFTNVFRELDKTTIPIMQELQRPYATRNLDLAFFNICLYRMFNWTPTYYETGGWCKQWGRKLGYI